MDKELLYFARLVNDQQNRLNNFVNCDVEDLNTLRDAAMRDDMSEIEIIEMILTLGYA